MNKKKKEMLQYKYNDHTVGAWEQLPMVHSLIWRMSYGDTQMPALDLILFNVFINDLDDEIVNSVIKCVCNCEAGRYSKYTEGQNLNSK